MSKDEMERLRRDFLNLVDNSDAVRLEGANAAITALQLARWLVDELQREMTHILRHRSAE